MRARSLNLGLTVICGILAALVNDAALAAQSAKNASLRIVVLEGEGAVNVIQQGTAVAPVVEVRDRNDQPVAGAVVSFGIRSGRATFNGARTLTVTTNVTGRAVATGLTPTGSGTLQISASAAFQGQTAAVTIAQTNAMTVAAAGGSASGGASATAGGAAGGGTGGGLSGTTLGILGGAVGGSVVAARELIHGAIYSGPFTGTLTMVFPGGCARPEIQNGTLEIELDEELGEIRGTWNAESDYVTPPGPCSSGGGENINHGRGEVSGTPERITFNGVNAGDNDPPNVNTYTFSFVGTLANGEIAGQFTLTREVGYPVPDPRNGRGSVTQSVILRKQ